MNIIIINHNEVISVVIKQIMLAPDSNDRVEGKSQHLLLLSI